MDALALLLIVLAGIDWLATVALIRAAVLMRTTDGAGEAALDERATAAMFLTIGATAVAIIGAAYLIGVGLPNGFQFLLIIAAFLALSVPQVIWAVAYLLGRFQ